MPLWYSLQYNLLFENLKEHFKKVLKKLNKTSICIMIYSNQLIWPLFTRKYPVTVVIYCKLIQYTNKNGAKQASGMFNVQKPSLN